MRICLYKYRRYPNKWGTYDIYTGGLRPIFWYFLMAQKVHNHIEVIVPMFIMAMASPMSAL